MGLKPSQQFPAMAFLPPDFADFARPIFQLLHKFPEQHREKLNQRGEETTGDGQRWVEMAAIKATSIKGDKHPWLFAWFF